MINRSGLSEHEIYLNFWGQVFVDEIRYRTSYTDQEKMDYFGDRMIRMGELIKKQALFGKPYITSISGLDIISIGFDENGRVVIPEKNNR